MPACTYCIFPLCKPSLYDSKLIFNFFWNFQIVIRFIMKVYYAIALNKSNML